MRRFTLKYNKNSHVFNIPIIPGHTKPLEYLKNIQIDNIRFKPLNIITDEIDENRLIKKKKKEKKNKKKLKKLQKHFGVS